MEEGISTGNRFMRTHLTTCLLAVVLILTAAVPRLFQLGHLGFYGDEETTALPAYAVATGGKPEMPSGMPYRRALPLTYLNATTAQLLGLRSELSYRLPSAVLGIMTVLLLFLLTKPFVGTSVAFLAALLLGLSEWHVVTSREARMYAPFLLFYMSAAFSTWAWIYRGGNARMFLAAGLIMATVSFHTLGIIALLFPLTGILFGDRIRVPIWHIIGFTSVTAIGAWIYKTYIIDAPFRKWNAYKIASAGEPSTSTASTGYPLTDWISAFDQWYVIAVLTIGFILGLWVTWLAHEEENAPGHWLLQIARYSVAGTVGAFMATAQVHGAALTGLIFLILHPSNLSTIFRSARHPILLLSVLMLASTTFVLRDHGLNQGIKYLLGTPFPYSWPLLQMLYSVFLLFLLMAAYLAFKAFRSDDKTARILALAALLPIVGIGFMAKWGGMRYLIEVYPFVLLLAAAGLLAGLQWLGQRINKWGHRGALLAATALVVSGVLGGHGIPQALRAATVDHGDTLNKLVFGFPVYPDHQMPGRFVAAQLQDNDLVVAEDTIQQKWYVGRVDYWLRKPVAGFLFQDADGQVRDIYTGSISLGQKELAVLKTEKKRRIWLITSGETMHARGYYLTEYQRVWLEYVEASTRASFVGRDSISKVYCLNCRQQEAQQTP